MADVSVLAAAWDRCTTGHRDQRFTSGAGTRVPGVEVLELLPGQRVLDLGCGPGDNAAHLAALGVQVTVLDLSPVQVTKARKRWGHVENLTVEQGEAVEYLSTCTGMFDAIYSVFGAAWYTDPEELLPAVAARLRAGGVFAFSQADVQPGNGRCNLDDPPEVERWDFRPTTWSCLLQAHGFQEITTGKLPATTGFRGWPTMLVTGHVPSDQAEHRAQVTQDTPRLITPAVDMPLTSGDGLLRAGPAQAGGSVRPPARYGVASTAADSAGS